MAGKSGGGGSSLVSVGLLGGAAYLAYRFFFASTASAAASPTAPAAPGLPAPAQPSAPAQPAFNSLDQTYQRLAQTIQQNSTDPALSQVQGQWTAVPDVFNYYLARVSSNSLPASAMGQLFGQEPQPATSLAAFWSAASGWLAQNKGLTGIGGRGLAGIIARGRR
jgi:hypothetical protein